jgi:hypothetical protein
MSEHHHIEQGVARRAEAMRWLASNGPDPAKLVAVAEGHSDDPEGALREHRKHTRELAAAKSESSWRHYLEANPERAREIVEGMDHDAR